MSCQQKIISVLLQYNYDSCYLFPLVSLIVVFWGLVLQFGTDKSLNCFKTKQVKNPLEEDEIVGITNYIDFGFELQTRYFK